MVLRTRKIEAGAPGGEPVCGLTREEASHRRVRPDLLLDRAELRVADDGYEARLPASDEMWALATAFIEEEARCCPFFAWEVTETNDAIIVRADTRTAAI